MEDKKICLNYYQVMILLAGINRLENENQKMNDQILESIKNYILERTKEITISLISVPLVIIKNLKLYHFSEESYNYVIKLIEIDPLDKTIVRKFKPLVKKIEEKSIQNLIGDYNIKIQTKNKK